MDCLIRKRAMLLLLIMQVLLAWGEIAAAEPNLVQKVDKSPLIVPKVDKPPYIDGKLDDPSWQKATVFTDFKTLHPKPGQPPSEKTEVYLAYDHQNIYIGFRCFDHEPEKIRAELSARGNPVRESPGSDDWVAFCLDTYDDQLGAFFFNITPGGNRTDGTLNRDGNPNVVINLIWSSATARTPDGWTAEMAIPFAQLPFPWKERTVMAFKAARFISRKAEEVDYPEINPTVSPHLALLQKIVFTGIDRNPTAENALALGLQETIHNKLRMKAKFDSLPFENRVNLWGDASVFDYLVYPAHQLKPSRKAFHFKNNPKAKKVASLFSQLEYPTGKRIGDMDEFLKRTLTTSFIIIKDDTIIFEKYFYGFKRDSMVTSFSMAKSFASTLIGIAIDEGLIGGVADPVTKYIPELKARDERFSRITIKDLLMMSAGLRYDEDSPSPVNDNDITYHSPDLRRAALEKIVIADPPGKYFLYNDYHPILIGMVLERVTGKPVTQYLQEKLWERIGMEYSGSWSTDSLEHNFEKMLVGINARSIDFAKLGRLFLNNGRWDGQSIVSQHWVEEAIEPEEKPSGYYTDPWFASYGHYYKYFWWGDKRSGGRNDFHAEGNKGQYTYVSPQKNLIIVRNGIERSIGASWLRLFHEFASKLE